MIRRLGGTAVEWYLQRGMPSCSPLMGSMMICMLETYIANTSLACPLAGLGVWAGVPHPTYQQPGRLLLTFTRMGNFHPRGNTCDSSPVDRVDSDACRRPAVQDRPSSRQTSLPWRRSWRRRECHLLRAPSPSDPQRDHVIVSSYISQLGFALQTPCTVSAGCFHVRVEQLAYARETCLSRILLPAWTGILHHTR